MTLEEYLQYFAEGVNAGVVFEWGGVEGGAQKMLDNLKLDNHTIHLVTHRSVGNCSMKNTEVWLKHHGIVYDTITFAKDKTILPVDVFIEDNVDNYKAQRDAGVFTVMMDRPWNQELTDAYRVYDWWEFYDVVSDVADGLGFIDETLAIPEYETGLQEAQRLVYGARQNTYQHPKTDYDCTSDLWTTILKDKLKDGATITPQEAILCMIQVKVSRLVHNITHRDSAVDVAGYAECILRVNRREEGLE